MNLETTLVGSSIGFFVAAFFVQYLLFVSRYLFFAGGAALVLRLLRSRLEPRKIQPKLNTKAHAWREIGGSLSTFVVFALIGTGTLWGVSAGYSQLYFGLGQRSWGYFLGSILGIVLLHDTYFYWAHRLMHWKLIYKAVHLTHHRSKDPTPWASFNFHPLEAILEAGIGPLVLFLVPVHPTAFLVFLLYMTFVNVLGHLGYEWAPKGFAYWFPFSWSNTSTAHNQHHRSPGYNFGLYFLFWDRVMRTLDPSYYDEFDQLQARIKESL